MKLLVLAIAFCALTLPAAADDRFGADNPTFAQFEATCRQGADMNPDCRGSVLGAFAEKAKSTPAKVACDFKAFWRVKDAKYGDRVSAVLPWQYGVEFVVAEPGVCK